MVVPNKIKNLIKVNKFFNVPKFIFIRQKDFINQEDFFLKKILKYFNNEKKIIIRSANYEEDKFISNAGKFDSIISPKKKLDLRNNIIKVFQSYNSKHKNNFVIVQKYVNDSYLSGVIFTEDPSGLTDYMTINYVKGKSTNLITSGAITGDYFVYFSKFKESKIKDLYLRKIINISKKIKKLFKYKNLDIEFSINKKKYVQIFQVRYLKTSKQNKLSDHKILFDLEKKLKKIIFDKNIISSKQTLYSNMTDWNPAEIIGIKPKPLALSLYKELITNDMWSKSREYLGYKDCYNLPLLYDFLGSPYIDIKLDLHSFIPQTLSESISKKLINYYINEFISKPDFYYDKVESELVFSAIDFITTKKIGKLKKFGFKKKEISSIKKELSNLTNNIIKKIDYNISISDEIKKKTDIISNKKIHEINKIFHLIHLCKTQGTLPFANLARMAFISIQFLNSMLAIKIINKKDFDEFLGSLENTTTNLNNFLLKNNFKKFINKFGHLRPNTYEISSKNYKENAKEYFDKKNLRMIIHKKFKFSKIQRKKISYNLKINQINIKIDEFLKFIEKSIIHREKSKFNFTYCLDKIFHEIKKIGKKNNINEEDLSYIDIETLERLYNNFNRELVKTEILNKIKFNKKQFYLNQNIKLPNKIINPEDIFMFNEKKTFPTFVTTKNIIGNILEINELSDKSNLDNKIILIRNADPGYDFIFTKKILGLITAFGGPNSHMFIRCNEINIPAAIGIGDENFNKLKKSKKISLNCNNKKIGIV